MEVENLVLEVGRQCNLKCRHCLRGDSQNMTMPFEMAIKVLKQFSSIGYITFSGGEPALYGKEISKIVDYIVDNNINVYGFYVASNGVLYNETLMNAIVKLYAYINDAEISSFEISNDIYHQESFDELYGTKNRYDNRLHAYRFVNNRGEINPEYLLREGNAAKNNLGVKLPDKNASFYFSYEGEADSVIATIYVSSKGQISPWCDYSYETLDSLNLPNINDIDNPDDFVKRIKQYNASVCNYKKVV